MRRPLAWWASWLVLVAAAAGAALLVGVGIGAALDAGKGWLVMLWAWALMASAWCFGYLEGSNEHTGRD